MEQIIVNGILMGFIYALVAVGLTLTWGVMDIINFAHGEFLMISMYTAFWMFTLFALDPLAALPMAHAPKLTSETDQPVRPSVRYFMANSISRFAFSKASLFRH